MRSKIEFLVTLVLLIFARVYHVNGQGSGFYFLDEQYFVFEGDNVEITVFRGIAATRACSVTATLTDTAPLDFDSTTHDFVFTAPTTDLQQTGGMMALTDLEAHEGIECFTLTLQTGAGGSCVPIAAADDITSTSICIIDRTPLFYIEEAQYIAKERTDLTIRIRRGGYQQHTTTVSVGVTVTGVTATGTGTDYTEPSPTTVTFAQGVDFVDMVIDIAKEDIKEDVETFTLTLNNPVGGVIDQPSVSRVFIIDESACVYIEEAEYFIGERGGTLTVRIRRRGYLWDTTDVTVDMTVTDVTANGANTDFMSPTTGTAIFTAGNEAVNMVFAIREDMVIEDTERFTITLSNPSRAALSDPRVATVFIEDQTTWFYIEEAIYVVGESSSALTVRIHRGGYRDAASAVTVDIAVMDVTAMSNMDFVIPVNTRASFGTDVDVYDMIFTINLDEMEENLESFTMALQNPSGGIVIQPTMTTVFIIDESVWFYLDAPRSLVGERDGSMTVSVRKGGYKSATATATVDVAISDVTATGFNAQGTGIDYTPTGISTVFFPAGVDHVDMPFIIVTPDELVEDVEKFTVTLQNPVGGFINPDEPSSTTVYILDETAWMYIEEESYIVGERVGTLTVRIRRGGYLGDTVSANLNIQDASTIAGTDYVVPVSTSVTFAPGVNYQNVVFSILADDVIEDKESFTITLTAPNGAMLGVPSYTKVYILDQTAFFWIEAKQYHVTEGDQLDVVFHRGGYISTAETLAMTISDGSATLTDDYSLPDDLSISFSPGATTSSKSLTILRDDTLEHKEYFVVTIGLQSSSSAAVLQSPMSADVIIADRSWYNLEAVEYTVWEHESTILVGIRREGDLRQTGSVEIAIEDGTARLNQDYSTMETSSLISFASGINIQHVPITIRQDDEYEKDEMITVILRTPSTGEALGNLHRGFVVILDDDAFFWIEEKQYHVTEGDQLDVVFHRGGYISTAETLAMTISDGSATVTDDYSLPDDLSVSFNSGATTSSKSLTILRDDTLEHKEYFVVTIGLQSSSSAAVLNSPMSADVIIADRSWYNLEAVEYTVWEHESTILVGIRREGDLRQTGSVEIAIEDGTARLNRDYSTVETSSLISFASGINIQHVPITIRQDDEYERDEMITIILRTPSTGEALGNLHRGFVVILDDDEPLRVTINWVVIIALSVIVALLIIGLLTSCMCYVRLARIAKRNEEIIFTAPKRKVALGSNIILNQLEYESANNNSAIDNFTFNYPGVTY